MNLHSGLWVHVYLTVALLAFGASQSAVWNTVTWRPKGEKWPWPLLASRTTQDLIMTRKESKIRRSWSARKGQIKSKNIICKVAELKCRWNILGATYGVADSSPTGNWTLGESGVSVKTEAHCSSLPVTWAVWARARRATECSSVCVQSVGEARVWSENFSSKLTFGISSERLWISNLIICYVFYFPFTSSFVFMILWGLFVKRVPQII